MSRLFNKVVLITGASSGIGASVAEKFGSHGARLALVGRNEKNLRMVSKKCEDKGGKALVIVADVTKDDDAARIMNDTIKNFGTLDVLVNNAGILGPETSIFGDNVMKEFDRVMATNLRAAVIITNLAAKYLMETKGNIVNVSSISAIDTVPRNFSYCTSKAGLDHFARAIAGELASKGVRINTVNPGPVHTDIFKNVSPETAKKHDKIYSLVKKVTALNRISEPEEVADLVFYLASDKAVGITGSNFLIDNGFRLKK